MLNILLIAAQVLEPSSITPADVTLRLSDGRPPKVYYPDQAMRLGVDGDVQARCVVGAGGKLEACELRAVSPANQGFDDSAGRLLPNIVVDPMAKDGQPTVGKSINLTIEYRSTGFRSVGPSREPRYSVKFK